MNRENVLKAIAIMERAKAHNTIEMSSYQSGAGYFNIVTTEEELHTCGNKACFAGYVAISPEFQADNGRADPYTGQPLLEVNEFTGEGVPAIAEWLDISGKLTGLLIYGDLRYAIDEPSYSRFYNKLWQNVNAYDVIAKLKLILNGELE